MLDRFLAQLMVGARNRAVLVRGAAAALAIAAVALVTRVSFDSDVLKLLPQDSPAVRSFQRFLENFGSLDHLYIVFESPEAIGDHAELVDAYVAALREAPEIQSVDAQLLDPDRDWTYLSDRVLLLLGPDGANDALKRFKPPALDAELRHARDLLSMPSADIKQYVQQDPLGLFGLMRTRLEREKGTIAFDPSATGYVSLDGRSRLVIVKPAGAPFDTDFCARLFQRLTDIERAVRASVTASGGDPGGVTVQPAGAYRVSLEAEVLIRRDGIVNSVSAMVLLLIVVYAVFRTPWVVIYGTIPLVLAGVLTLGLNGVLRGRLSPATSGAAGMLFGLGIDGVIMLYLRYLEERQAGRSPIEATAAMAGTGSAVILAQITTVATFLALLVIDFPTLQDLGALVGLGMLLVMVLTPVLVPAFLGRATGGERGRARSARWLARLVTGHARTIVWAGLAATILCAVASTQLRIDPRIERLQPRTAGAGLEEAIAVKFSLPRDVLLVTVEHNDLQQVLETDERLAAVLTSRVPGLATAGAGVLLPSERDQRAVTERVRAASLTSSRVARDLATSAAAAGFRDGTFAPFIERVPRLLDSAARITYDGLISHGLAPALSRFLTLRDGRYVSVTYVYPPPGADIDLIDAAVRDASPAAQLTGLPVINRDMAARFLPEFRKGLIVGAAAVALLIFATFRTIRHTLLALLPTAIGFIWSAGLLAIAQVDLDLFSLFATVTFIGMAVDYGIYVLYRYAIEGERDMGAVLSRTGAAIIIACSTALVGFGTLVFSNYPPLRMFGVVSVVTLACCLAASLLFLPAVILETARWRNQSR